jgi:hypothetical protein
MDGTARRKLLELGAMGCAHSVLGPFCAQAQRKAVAYIERTIVWSNTGSSCRLKRGEQESALNPLPGTELFAGDILTTGELSSLKIVYFRDSPDFFEFILSSASSVLISGPNLLESFFGSLSIKLKGAFAMKLGKLSLGPKGTELQVNQQPASTQIRLIEGAVEATGDNNSFGGNPKLIVEGTEASYVRGDLSTWKVRLLEAEEKRPDPNLRGNSAALVERIIPPDPPIPREKFRIDWSTKSIDSELRSACVGLSGTSDGITLNPTVLLSLLIRSISRSDVLLLAYRDELSNISVERVYRELRERPVRQEDVLPYKTLTMTSPIDFLTTVEFPQMASIRLTDAQRKLFESLLVIENPPLGKILKGPSSPAANSERVRLLSIVSAQLYRAGSRSTDGVERTLYRLIELDYRLVCARQRQLAGGDSLAFALESSTLKGEYLSALTSAEFFFRLDCQFGLIRALALNQDRKAHRDALSTLEESYTLSVDEISSLQLF